MTMNLILQGPAPDPASMQGIAAMARARTIVELNPRTWRCEQAEDDPALRLAVLRACFDAGIDGNYMRAGRRLSDFGLLAMDMDSTLITIECIDEIADMQGLKPQVARITEAAMRGEIAFAESLVQRVALLRGLDHGALQQVYEQRLRFSPGATVLIERARKAGLKTLLVSGGFTYFTERVKQQLGLDFAHANVLEIEHGKLTGRVVGDIVDAAGKRRMVESTCAALGIASSGAIVIGDGANDLEMMSIAGLSVAYRAKPIVRAQAGAALNFNGLDGILSLFDE